MSCAVTSPLHNVILPWYSTTRSAEFSAGVLMNVLPLGSLIPECPAQFGYIAQAH